MIYIFYCVLKRMESNLRIQNTEAIINIKVLFMYNINL